MYIVLLICKIDEVYINTSTSNLSTNSKTAEELECIIQVLFSMCVCVCIILLCIRMYNVVYEHEVSWTMAYPIKHMHVRCKLNPKYLHSLPFLSNAGYKTNEKYHGIDTLLFHKQFDAWSILPFILFDAGVSHVCNYPLKTI